MIAAATILTATALARAADTQPTCADVVAAMEVAGTGVSTDEIAKKLGTTAEHVRQCWDQKDTDTKADATGK
jgi:hypothetical protein